MVKLFILAPLVIATVISAMFGIGNIMDLIYNNSKETKAQKAKKEEIENNYKAYLSNEYGYRVWHPIGSIANKLAFPADKTQRVVDMPRLTFERWLTFYNLNPENWFIQTSTDFYSSLLMDIPYYAKLNEDKKWIILPVFWSSPEEMGKYRDWLENEYQRGDARIYQQRQEESYKRLVNLVENDIKERQDKVQQDLLNMRKELLNIKKEEKSVTFSQLDNRRVQVQNSDGSVSIV